MDIEKEAHKILKKNRQTTDGQQYTLPSTHSYPYQWLWDSCFHAIALSILEPEAAKKELRSLASKQFEDGMIPHLIYWQEGDLHKYEWGKDGTSAITQPPMLAYAVLRIYEKDNDRSFLEEMYPALWKFYRYLLDKRDPRHHHLIGIINPDESGEDNSPRFDSCLDVSPMVTVDEHLKKRLALIEKNKKCNFNAESCMKNHFWVKDVPFNTIMVANLENLKRIAYLLGKEADARFCEFRIGSMKMAMRDLLYADGLFWSAEGNEYRQIKVATWAHFAPLFGGLYSEEEAARVVADHLLNEETFLSPHGIRTVSKQEKSYDPTGFWRGPIWMAPHWFIHKGLQRYGFKKEAQRVLDLSVVLLEKEGFREYYNPETGEGLGAENFTWGALVVDMMN